MSQYIAMRHNATNHFGNCWPFFRKDQNNGWQTQNMSFLFSTMVSAAMAISGQLPDGNEEKKYQACQCPSFVLLSLENFSWKIKHCKNCWYIVPLVKANYCNFPSADRTRIFHSDAILCYRSPIGPGLVSTCITSLQLLDEGCGHKMVLPAANFHTFAPK